MDPLELASQWDAIGLVPLLLWLHWSGEKTRRVAQEKSEAQIDRLSQQWEAQIDQMLERADRREIELRDRFDKTVEKLDAERAALQAGLVEELKALSARVEDVIRFIARPSGR